MKEAQAKKVFERVQWAMKTFETPRDSPRRLKRAAELRFSPWNGEVFEKAGSGSRGDGFWGLRKAAGSRWDPLAENIVLGGLDWRQTGIYSQPPGGQKTNSG